MSAPIIEDVVPETEDQTIAEMEDTTEELLEQTHGVAYLGWVGRTLSRLPKIIAHQRWMAYASEGTEPFRPVAHPWLVRSGYVLSFFYVAMDIGVRTHAEYRETQSREKSAIVFGDSLVFHGFASLLLPAVLIHAIVKHSSVGLVRTGLFAKHHKVREYAPTVLGLASIPFVVGPIDHGVEWVMDNTVRQFYEVHTEHEHKE